MAVLDTDLIVAGGGPVGLATAILARREGLRVHVVEPRIGPVDKACGEGLMPSALAALSRLGVDPAGHDLAGIRYLAEGASAEAHFRHGPGRGVRRTVLHAALAQRAQALGVGWLEGRVRGVAQDGDAVVAGGMRGRWLAAADGLHSPLRRDLGLQVLPPRHADRRQHPSQDRYGLRRHYRVRPWTDFVEVHWAARAEAYVTPVGPDCVGVSVLCPGGAPYDEWLAGFPQLAARLAGAEPASPVRGAGPLRQRARRRSAGRVLLVGDAAGYVDALTGEGLAVGLAGAEALVRCLVAGRPQDYEAAWRRATYRSRALTSGVLWATRRPALRRRTVPVAARAPGLFGGLVAALA